MSQPQLHCSCYSSSGTSTCAAVASPDGSAGIPASLGNSYCNTNNKQDTWILLPSESRVQSSQVLYTAETMVSWKSHCLQGKAGERNDSNQNEMILWTECSLPLKTRYKCHTLMISGILSFPVVCDIHPSPDHLWDIGFYICHLSLILPPKALFGTGPGLTITS